MAFLNDNDKFVNVVGAPNPAQVMGRSELSPEDQLAMLRQLTKRTGVLHEAQVQHLRLWPYAVDPELTKHIAKTDLDNRVVEYEWEDIDKREGWKPDKSYKTRLERLLESVRFLLGESWEMTVKMNNVTIFSSRTPRARKGSRKSSKRSGAGRKKHKRKHR